MRRGGFGGGLRFESSGHGAGEGGGVGGGSVGGEGDDEAARGIDLKSD